MPSKTTTSACRRRMARTALRPRTRTSRRRVLHRRFHVQIVLHQRLCRERFLRGARQNGPGRRPLRRALANLRAQRHVPEEHVHHLRHEGRVPRHLQVDPALLQGHLQPSTPALQLRRPPHWMQPRRRGHRNAYPLAAHRRPPQQNVLRRADTRRLRRHVPRFLPRGMRRHRHRRHRIPRVLRWSWVLHVSTCAPWRLLRGLQPWRPQRRAHLRHLRVRHP